MNEFPEQLPWSADPEERDGAVYFYLDSCPVNGGPHTIQNKKTAIILRENAIGFSCFAGKCQQPKFRDVLKMVEEQSGHKHQTPIWFDPTLKEQIEAWGGAEWADPELIHMPRKLYKIPQLLKHADDVIELDGLTFEDLLGAIRELVRLEEERLRGWQLESFLHQISRMVDTHDVEMMARYLGAEMLQDLKWWACKDRLIDARFAERERAERSASAWLADPVPIPVVWLSQNDLLPAFKDKALKIDASITNYYGKLVHRHLIQQTLSGNDVNNMARFLGWHQVQEIADLAVSR
jgi:hypothetical protein